MNSIITSDVHLGCTFSDPKRFITFLGALPDDAELILAGDLLDRPKRTLCGHHATAWQRLASESKKRRIVWVKGNHDSQITPSNMGAIERVDHYLIRDRLLVLHGHKFDTSVCHRRWFLHLTRLAHLTRGMTRTRAIHMARYVKHIHWLHSAFRGYVMRNAIQQAKDNGVQAVLCGHTHYAEAVEMGDMHYFNSGAWTEPIPFCLRVNDMSMDLIPAL